jgi:hypothetical protein
MKDPSFQLADLAPAQASVVLGLPRIPESEPLKVTLQWLFLRGLLKIETEDRGRFRKKRFWLTPAPSTPPDLPLHAATLLDMVRDLDPKRAGFTALVGRMRRDYGPGFFAYQVKYLWTDLIACGVMTRRQKRLLGLFNREIRSLTPLGEDLKERLKQGITQAAALPALLQRDPREAALLAARLGPAVLLISGALAKYLGPLFEAMHQHLDRAAETGHGDGGCSIDAGAAGGVDFSSTHADAGHFGAGHFGAGHFGAGYFGGGHFDFGGVDFGSLDAGFDAAWGAFDAGLDSGFDSGGGDGGGDSGGGHH